MPTKRRTHAASKGKARCYWESNQPCNRQPATENRKPKTDNRQPLFVLRLNSEEAYTHESDSTNFVQSWRRWRRVFHSRIRPAAGLRPIAGAQNLPLDRNPFHVPLLLGELR